MKKYEKSIIGLIAIVVIASVAMLSGCLKETPESTPTPTSTLSPTFAPSPTSYLTPKKPGNIIIDEKGDVSGPNFVDILEAKAIQTDSDGLQFSIKTNGKVLDSNGTVYIWFVDADKNSATGQLHGDIGSEYNIRTYWDANNRVWGSCIDLINENRAICELPKFYKDDTVYILVKKSLIGNIDSFNWSAETFGPYGGDSCEGYGIFTFNKTHNAPIYRIITDNEIFDSPHSMYLPKGGSVELNLIKIDNGTEEIVNPQLVTFTSNRPEIVGIENNIAYDNTTDYSDITDKAIITATILDSDHLVIVNDKIIAMVGDLYKGKNNAFIIPGSFIPASVGNPNVPGNITFDEMMHKYNVVHVTDINYEIQKQLVGMAPLNGDPQLWAFDYLLCGGAGQPIGLGYGCIENPENEPHWGVFYHEAGHVFTEHIFGFHFSPVSVTPSCDSPKFGGLTKFVFSEGFATLNGMYSIHEMIQNPSKYNIDEPELSSLKRAFNGYGYFRTKLKEYEEEGGNYEKINPDVIDGIFLELADEYGWEIYPKFYKVFLPEYWDQYDDIKEGKGATFFVTALSAASGDDLRARFEKWDFPIDDKYFNNVYPILKEIIDR